MNSSDTPPRDPHIWQIKAVRDVFWIAMVVFLLWFGYLLRAIFTPVLIALALAYLFHPWITFCEKRWKMPRPATISLILFAAALTLAVLAAWLGPVVVRQTSDFVSNVPRQLEIAAQKQGVDLGTVLEQIDQWTKQVTEDPGTYIMQTVKLLFAGGSRAVDMISQVLGTTAFVLLTLALIPIYFFFFAWQFGPMTTGFEQYLPASSRKQTMDVIRKMDEVIATFFRGRVIIALIMAVMFAIGWAFAGVPYWFLLGMAAGVLSLVPYVSGVIWPLAVALKWLEVSGASPAPGAADAAGFEFWAVVFWPSLVFFVVQGMEAWVLTPWIQGQSLNLSVVTILLVVLIGGAVGGLYGLLLCIPIAACIKILLNEMLLPNLKAWAAEH